MAEIRSLYGVDIHQSVAREDVVAFLENVLERARAGEVIGVGVAALHNNFEASYAVVGGVGGYSMLGALDMIRAEIVEINRDEDGF